MGRDHIIVRLGVTIAAPGTVDRLGQVGAPMSPVAKASLRQGGIYALQAATKCMIAVRISGCAQTFSQDRQRLGDRHGCPVRPIGCQGIENVGRGDDARLERVLRAFGATRITLPVQPLVMRAGA